MVDLIVLCCFVAGLGFRGFDFVYAVTCVCAGEYERE